METFKSRFESGDTVDTFENLVIYLRGQSPGFNLNLNVWYGDHLNLWRKAEELNKQKIALTIMKIFTYDGKPACMVNFKIL